MKSFDKKENLFKKFESTRGAAATPAPLVRPPMSMIGQYLPQTNKSATVSESKIFHN